VAEELEEKTITGGIDAKDFGWINYTLIIFQEMFEVKNLGGGSIDAESYKFRMPFI